MIGMEPPISTPMLCAPEDGLFGRSIRSRWRTQYVASTAVGRSWPQSPGHRQEPDVAPIPKTETYVAPAR
jgi:hypothetical protein